MPIGAILGLKREALDSQLRGLGRTLVAYSGGVDSAFLAWAAYQVLGNDMLAVIADSASLASSHLADAIAFAREVLSVVEQGEDALRNLGFRQFRVRHHGDIVRIEIAREEMSRALTPEMAAEFARIFKSLGFKFVTLDLEGFRSGSMNSLLSADQLTRAQ